MSQEAPSVTSSSTRRITPWRVAVPAVALAAGILFGMTSHASRGSDLRSGQTDLADVVQAADHRVKVKQHQMAALRQQIERQEDVAKTDKSPGDAGKKLQMAVDQAAPTAGLTPLTGRSVTVTLDDSKQSVDQLPDGGSPDWLVVHQQDVQSFVNALWRGGAQGMMLMDQRVVSTSAVRCVGNTLILQGRVYSPPFRITAVGDPDKLKAVLDQDPSVKIYKQYVDAVGLGYDVKVAPKTTLPPYTGSVLLRHARVTN